MKKLKLFGAFLLLVPAVTSCNGFTDLLKEDEEVGNFDIGNISSSEDSKTSNEGKKDSEEEPKQEPSNPEQPSSPDQPDGPAANTFTVVWHNGSEILEIDQKVEKGSVAEYNGQTPIKDSDDDYEYTFLGWNTSSGATTILNPLPTVENDLDLYAIFKATAVTKYTVKFFNQGQEISGASRRVKEGTYNIKSDLYKLDNPTKAEDEAGKYSFKGWAISRPSGDINGNIVTEIEVTKDISLHASFILAKNSFTITWMNNGSVYDSTTHEAGETPSPSKSNPTKPSDYHYNYTFVGWNSDPDATTGLNPIPAVSKNDTYYAIYSKTVRQFKISFWNGNTWLKDVYKTFGTYNIPSLYDGPTPQKESSAEFDYTFKGWATSIFTSNTVTNVEVNQNQLYYAAYNNITREYLVTWKNYDGSTITTSKHKYGTKPSYPGTTPVKPSDSSTTYTFKGWSTEIDGNMIFQFPDVTGPAVYYAIYESEQVVTKEQLKADTRKLTAQGDGYTYLDYNLAVKYKSWSDLVSGGYVSISNNNLSSFNLDSLGKGVLQLPEDSTLIYSKNDTTNLFSNCELLDGLNIPACIWQSQLLSLASGCTTIRTLNFLAPKSSSTNSNLTSIGNSAFKGCSALESVNFANPKITTLGNYVFQDCISLENITFSSGLTSIGAGCFKGAVSLGEVTLPSTLTSIGDNGFEGSGITKLNVNSSVNFGASSFVRCSDLTTVTASSSAKIKINGSSAFRYCSNLTNFPFAKLEWGSSSFIFANTGFTSVDFTSSSVTTIQNYAFFECNSLTTVKLTSSIKSFGNGAFQNCANLTTISNINPAMTEIGLDALCNCSKLETLSFSSGSGFTNLNVGITSFYGSNLSTLNITTSAFTNYDGQEAFGDMKNLTTVTLNITNDTYLPEGLFNGCTKLKTVNLNVKYDTTKVNKTNKTDGNTFKVGYYTNDIIFSNCNSLETINFSGSVDQFMNYYRVHSSQTDAEGYLWDKALDIRYNTKLKIVCAKGYVKNSQTSAFTINSSNFVTTCKAFSIYL